MNRLRILRDRAEMLQAARKFFEVRGIMEVDVPLLSQRASIDAHIDLIPALYDGKLPCTLHSSPEYGMKRLLVEGIGDIFQLSHVFRDGELGCRHNPEFMIAEWYRVKGTFEEMIDETLDFIRLFLGPLRAEKMTYRDVFLKYADLDALSASFEEIKSLLNQHRIPLYRGLEEEGKDGALALLLSSIIEPQLGTSELFAITHYPATQAALAKTLPDGTAERFEIYHRGLELANGYHELADADEQEKRLHSANDARQKMGKPPLALDRYFLSALQKGLPPCCGVAVGFDRLMMLRQGISELGSVLPFPFPMA